MDMWDADYDDTYTGRYEERPYGKHIPNRRESSSSSECAPSAFLMWYIIGLMIASGT